MEKKLSGSAIFMYSMMGLTFLLAGVCFALYYGGICQNSGILWTGIVSFMILYHFGLRILMGEITKLFAVNYCHGWFQQRPFEKKLYQFLRVRNWKGKVLTFDPGAFDVRSRTPRQIATTMAKSELDHWINELISLTSLLFFFLWGCFPAFLITAVLAMLFDAQFIVVQRYNRPKVLRLIEKQQKKAAAP